MIDKVEHKDESGRSLSPERLVRNLDKFDKKMQAVRRDYIIKAAASRKSAKEIVFTA